MAKGKHVVVIATVLLVWCAIELVSCAFTDEPLTLDADEEEGASEEAALRKREVGGIDKMALMEQRAPFTKYYRMFSLLNQWQAQKDKQRRRDETDQLVKSKQILVNKERRLRPNKSFNRGDIGAAWAQVKESSQTQTKPTPEQKDHTNIKSKDHHFQFTSSHWGPMGKRSTLFPIKRQLFTTRGWGAGGYYIKPESFYSSKSAENADSSPLSKPIYYSSSKLNCGWCSTLFSVGCCWGPGGKRSDDEYDHTLADDDYMTELKHANKRNMMYGRKLPLIFMKQNEANLPLDEILLLPNNEDEKNKEAITKKDKTTESSIEKDSVRVLPLMAKAEIPRQNEAVTTRRSYKPFWTVPHPFFWRAIVSG